MLVHMLHVVCMSCLSLFLVTLLSTYEYILSGEGSPYIAQVASQGLLMRVARVHEMFRSNRNNFNACVSVYWQKCGLLIINRISLDWPKLSGM